MFDPIKNKKTNKTTGKKDLKNKEQLSLHGVVLKSLLYHAYFYKFGGGCVVKEKPIEIMGRQPSLLKSYCYIKAYLY